MTTALRDAATVMPLRDGTDGLEVFMLKRAAALTFLGGNHVFPGGAVDDEDRGPALDSLVAGFDAPSACAQLDIDDGDKVRSFYVAAVRELFEEAGILIAGCNRSVVEGDFSVWQQRLVSGESGFCELLKHEGLVIAADELCYFAHWVTPEGAPRRFDTRFFLVRMPAGQVATHDGVESTEGCWISPQRALVLYARREMALAPPTIVVLDRLCLNHSVAEALEAARLLDVGVVSPKISLQGDEVAILYPGDPDYDSGVAGLPAAGRLLNRLVLRDGLWGKP